MTRRARLRKTYHAEFHYGQRIADRLHVSDSNRAVIRACRKAIGRKPANWTRTMRDARHAIYSGAIAAHEANRNLFRHYRF